MTFEDEKNIPTTHSFFDGASCESYREDAKRLLREGAKAQAWYLLMASYEAASLAADADLDASSPAVDDLRSAWDIASELRERNLAAQTFELLEPYLSFEEVEKCMNRIQEFDNDRMGSFGIAMSEMGDIAAALSEKLIGKARDGHSADKTAIAPTPEILQDPKDAKGFERLVGFERAIEDLRTRGFGVQNDEDYLRLIEQLNAQHGMEYHPSRVPLIFRAVSREDANRLMLATAEELDLPVIRMRMDEGPQGDPVLSVITTFEPSVKNGIMIPGHTGPGVLILEDLDQWYFPTDTYQSEDFGYQSLTRGARRALSLIGSSASQGDVVVLASVAAEAPLEGFMFEMLEPFDLLDVDEPTEAERADIWEYLVSRHNSLSTLDRFELVRLSAHMPRSDIFAAAREAIEQSYREGLEKRCYLPVSAANIFDKIAAYQPLDSEEYKAIEQMLVDELMDDISNIDGAALDGFAQ